MPAATETARDWLASTRSSIVAWWLPHAALLGGLLVPAPGRAIAWTAAMVWMGLACLLNSRRCGRTHCRYTGPYYVAMIVPVLLFGSGIIAASIYERIALGLVIIGGSKLIWWAGERRWGTFS